MRTVLRRHRLLLVSLLLGFCAFALSYSLLSGYVKTGPVVVALRDLDVFAKIAITDVKVVETPVKAIPKLALRTVADAVGKSTRSRVVSGQALQEGHVVSGKEAGGLSYDLPRDRRGIFLPVPASRAVGGMVRQGEKVDVIVASKGMGSGYDSFAGSAFTVLKDLWVTEVVRDKDSDEFLGVIVLALPNECETVAEHIENANLYLVLVPRETLEEELRTGVWPPQ